jgi:amino acid transporter
MNSAFVRQWIFLGVGALTLLVLIIVIIIVIVLRKKRHETIAQHHCRKCGSIMNPEAAAAAAARRIPNLPFKGNRLNILLIAIMVVCEVVMMGTLVLLTLKLTDRALESMAYKPVVYLYPEQETDVSASIGINPERFTVTYPTYGNSCD